MTAKKTTTKKAETKESTRAKMATDGRFLAAVTVQRYSSVIPESDLKISSIFHEIIDNSNAVIKGDLNHVEDVLFSQATALDAVFHEMLRRAADNMGQYPIAFDRYMKLGLKAQSQCRSTLEALAEIKQPKSVTIAKQANIADQQVVNNGTMSTKDNTHAREKNQNSKNELLGQVHHDSLDSGTAAATIRTDETVETVGTVNRA